MVDPLLTFDPTTDRPGEGIGGPPLEPPPAPPAAPEQTYDNIMFPMVDRWSEHPGRALTPERVVEIFSQAELGYTTQQCDLFEDVTESDAHLRSQRDARLDAVTGKNWEVQAGGDQPADHAAAQEFQDALALASNFDEFLEHQQLALYDGFAASRIRWSRLDGTWVPVWFDNVPARRLRFDGLGYPRLLTAKEPWRGVPLDAGEWVYTRGRRHRSAAMSGLMRTATWWTMFKRMNIRDWVVFNARFGLPFPYGVYPDGMPQKERDALELIVRALGSGKSGIMHERMKIEVLKTEGGGNFSPQAALAGFCNAEISKLFTGATLTSGEGSSTGSYALGRVHEDKFFTFVLADARWLERATVQKQLSEMFCTFNGITAKRPTVKIHVVRDQDPMARVDVLSRLANELGLEIDEDQVRLEFQIKAPTGKALKGQKTASAIEATKSFLPKQTV